MNLEGTFQEALRFIAERRLMHKLAAAMANPAALAAQAQSARQQLGVLGVDPDAVNEGAAGARTGKLPSRQAFKKIRSGVPGGFEQLGNIPAGITTALSQGRPGDALAQADVAGLKNVTPGSDSFSPATMVASGALGATALGAQLLYHHINDRNQAANQILNPTAGSEMAKLDPLRNSFRGVDKPLREAELDAWRQSQIHTPPAPSAARSILDAGTNAQGFGNKLRAAGGEAVNQLRQTPAKLRNWFARPEGVHLPAVAVDAKLKNNPGVFNAGNNRAGQAVYQSRNPAGPTSHVDRDVLHNLAKQHLATNPTSRGLLGRVLLPGMAALAPLAAREWLSTGGYRSGSQPAQQLVDANEGLRGK